MNNEVNEKISLMMNKLVPILNEEESVVGASAMVNLLYDSAKALGCDKEMWLKQFWSAWDHYEKLESEEVKI